MGETEQDRKARGVPVPMGIQSNEARALGRGRGRGRGLEDVRVDKKGGVLASFRANDDEHQRNHGHLKIHVAALSILTT
jgi:hypothetical protein